ncbi:MAG: adenylate/guanylate cyclase domain-containing protein [Sulfitobacter sp.]|nr:adenylate/guanylate cyclase domain-containing protein [Sulfitobacter sp.]
MNELNEILNDLGLAQYIAAFEANDIDITLIGELTMEDLKEIGVSSLGHRKKIFAALQAASEDQGSDANTQTAETSHAERRQVTTVFADLTGYTQLSRELDNEDLHDVLSEFYDRFNEIVTRMGGTIDRHIGDCVMAVFGAPVSHGNDTERALRTSIEMHRAMEELSRRFGRELSVHIGAATGTVLFSTKGYGQRKDRDFSLTGETVNLASRLADQAKGKETLIDDQIFLSLSHMMDCDAPVTLEVKGFDTAVLGHRFKGFRKRGTRKALIGRDMEVDALEKVLKRTRAEGAGETIYVCADAGMGKSHMLYEFIDRARLQGFDPHSTLVLDFGLGDAQSPLNKMVSSLFGLGENAQRSAIRGVVNDLAVGDRFDDVSGVFLSVLLGGEPDREQAVMLAAMSDQARTDAQKETLRRIVRHFSGQKPLFLVVEDIHWADPSILPSIEVLIEESQTNPVVLVITSRLEGVVTTMDLPDMSSDARVRQMVLRALSVEEATKLAYGTIHPSEEIIRQCIERAQGNPLFLEQLLSHAHESGEQIPSSIQSLIQSRFDRLAPLDKKILHAAAILGQRFSMPAVTQIAQVDVYDENVLLQAGLIKQIDDGYLFEHALIRDAILGTILRDELRRLHKMAATWYAGRDLVLHAQHLDAAGDEQAAGAYLAAAQEARARYLKDAALGFAEKGLSNDPDAQTRYRLLHIKGDVQRELGKGTLSIDTFTLAQQVAETDKDICRAQIGIVAAMRILDRIDEAFDLLDVAQKRAESAGLLTELSEIHYFRGALHFPKGNLDECKQDHTKSLEYAKRAEKPERQALALSGLGDAAYARGQMFTAHSVIEECLELCDLHGFGAVESSNRFMLATVKIYMNETEQALHHALRSAELAAQVGLNRPEIVSRLTAGWILTSMARYEDARSQIATGLKLADALGAKRFEPFLEETLARIEFYQGNWKRAADVAEGALVKLYDVGAESFIGPWVMSTVALTTPDPDRRGAMLAEAEALLAKGCVGHNYFRFYRNAIQACLNAQDWDAAERYAGELARYTAPEPTPWSDFHIDRARAMIAQGRGENVTQTLEELHKRARDGHLLNALPLRTLSVEVIGS